MLSTTIKSKNNKSKTARSKTSSNFYRKTKKLTENQLAIEETKKLYQKYYENPNPLFLSQLKTETINVYLSNFKYNDILVINKILNKYFFFKYLSLAPEDPMKKNKKNRNKNGREPITEGEKVKLAKEKRDQEIENMHKINKITLGIGKHLINTNNLIVFSIINFDIDQNFAQNLSKGISENKSIHVLCINNCKMSIESYEILLKGLLNHDKIEYLDLSNNNLGDKYGNMIGRIIARQTYRRDQEIWLYGLRNEFPLTNDYALGLIKINLDGNLLSSYAADCITTSLASDQYVRSIILTNNNMDTNSCKKFIYMLRRNMTLLNIDLRDNPGYDENIKIRLVMKMSKNIHNLYIQFKNKKYTETEFQNYKRFIDTSFFDLDIPEEIVEFYNDNIQKIAGNNINSDNGGNNKVLKNNINKVMSDIQEEEKEYSNSNASKNSLSLLASNSKNKNKGVISKNNSKNNNYSVTEIDNKKLFEENLLLKKKILELKAENIQNKYGKTVTLPTQYNMDNLNKNYKIADELFDKLSKIMTTMGNNEEKEKEKEKNNKIINTDINNIDNNKIKQINNKINYDDNKIMKYETEKEKENKKSEKENKKENEKEIQKKNEDVKIEINNDNEDKEEKEIIIRENDINKNNIIVNDKNKDNKEKEEKEINKINYIANEEEDDEREGLENLNEDDFAILQHQHLYEQLKKEYDAKGLKFDIEDYMELLQNAAEQEEEDE